MSLTLLALETATDRCGVALLQKDRVTVELTLSRPRAHAANLVPLIRDALAYAGDLAPTALDAVAVSMGPGSYTGLRIGVSTAKGLALATGAALIGVPSLECVAMAAAPMAPAGAVILAVFNARRDEFYAAAFRRTDAATLTPMGEAVAAQHAALAETLPDWGDSPLWIVGEAAEAAARALGPRPDAQVLPTAVPTAGAVALLGAARLARGETAAVDTFEPFYLKAFVARARTRSVYERLPF